MRRTMPQANRFFNFAGVPNFRHMGGYSTADGRKTRGDLLFRSGYVELVTQADVNLFETLGIEVVFDFRTRVERNAWPRAALKILWCDISEWMPRT